MMQQRKLWVESLSRTLLNHSWVECKLLLFRVFYGLSPERQVELACATMRRYLPIFETHWPGSVWPGQLLNDPWHWFQEFGRNVPEEPAEVGPADAAYIMSFDGLLLACSYRDHPTGLASSCAFAVAESIQARRDNVWAADDPQAVALWKSLAEECNGFELSDRLREYSRRDPEHNVAAIAVSEREWKQVVAWLTAHEIWTDPSDINFTKLEQAVDLWQQHEMLLMPRLDQQPA